MKYRTLLLSTLVAWLVCCAAGARAAEAVWAQGITEPLNDVTMSSPIIGIVGARPFEEGDLVKKGQVVLELEKRFEELEVQRKQLIRDQAKIELDRIKSLAAKNAISVSREELDKKEAEFKVASVESELAQEQLRKRLLLAPFDGFITDIYRDVGEGCEAQQPLLRIVDTRRCYFTSNLEAKTGYGLKVGQKVRLEIEAGASPVTFDGTISYVSPVVDPASGLLKVKAIFDNPDGRIRPGVAGRMMLP
ncbi:MAG: efflux RND transporter periplasmic adaptor subunit [Verrucomicrobiota bacterium]